MTVIIDRPLEVLSWRDTWQRIAIRVSGVVDRFALEFGIDASTLQKQVLLHLPRFDKAGLESPKVIQAEVGRLAQRIAILHRGWREWLSRPRIAKLSRSQVKVRAVPESVATIVQERFHYIGAARKGIHLGLYHEAETGLPAALATLSPLDVEHLRARLASSTDAGWILSRVYAFPWAPRNSITALLGAICRQVRVLGPGRTVFFTYVNPNLLFTGSSYRAANWCTDGTHPIRYRYFADNYVTARQAQDLGPAIHWSQFALSPLEIWRWDQ